MKARRTENKKASRPKSSSPKESSPISIRAATQPNGPGGSGLEDEHRYMELAIEQARASKGEDQRTHPLVGVVVVKDGQVLASAYRGELDAGEHAEFTALERKLIDADLVGATVYTTLEPCTARNHPKLACAHRLIERRVARVVIGMLDPNPGICGRGVWLLRDARVATDFFPDGLMSKIEAMNREFIRLHRPPARLEAPRTPPMESKAPETPTPTEPAERAIAAASPESTDKNKVEKQLFDEFYDAMLDKKFDEGKQKFEELAAQAEKGPAKRLKVIYLELLYSGTSHEEPFEELKQLCDDPDAGDFASGTLGSIAMLANDYTTAIERFKMAAAKAGGPEGAASWLSNLADTYRKIGELDEARRTVLEALGKSIGDSTRAGLLTKLGEIYGDMRLPLLRAALLSRAAQLMPADATKRFDAAYALAEQEGTREASALLYNSVLAMDKKHATAANNLGVQCLELGMKGQSVAFYRQAWKNRETLAAANLAILQIEAGFLDDAEMLLDEAKHSRMGC
jgi:pyrimidine deaminase RibD-like protein/tetratricopeptide (TPR) repeat protein